MTTLRQEDNRAIEQTRQRLYQLTQSIGSLKNDILTANPMPPWDSIQRSAQILTMNLNSLTEHLSKHVELFDKAVVYPSTNYPGRTQEGLLGQLLRKKLEPAVETWTEEGKAFFNSNSEAEMDVLDELWDFARESTVHLVVEAAQTYRRENYTAEERAMGIENVKTGLRVPPKLQEPQEGESEDESESGDVEMQDAEQGHQGVVETKPTGPVRTQDEILRFMVTGLEPEDDKMPPISSINGFVKR